MWKYILGLGVCITLLVLNFTIPAHFQYGYCICDTEYFSIYSEDQFGNQSHRYKLKCHELPELSGSYFHRCSNGIGCEAPNKIRCGMYEEYSGYQHLISYSDTTFAPSNLNNMIILVFAIEYFIIKIFCIINSHVG